MPLLGARFKVIRARQHLAALDHETRVFVDSIPFDTVGEIDSDAGAYIVRIRYRPGRKVPIRLGLIAGDVVHNLRSALDHIAYELAGTAAGRHTAFPIYEDSVGYATNTARTLRGVDQAHQATIERLQPYRVKLLMIAGTTFGRHDPLLTNFMLMAIARLDNIDKHRTLLPALPILPFKPPAFIGVKAAKVEYPGAFVRMDDGVEVYRITDWELAPGASKASVTNSPSYGIVFGNPTYDAATIWDDVEKSAMSAVDMRLAADLVEETIALFD